MDRPGTTTTFERLAEELERRFTSQHALEPWPEEELEGLARRIFAHQFHANATYRAFCEARGVTPDRLTGWRAVPAVPARAFQHVELVSVDRLAEGAGESAAGRAGSRDAAAFRTSGTTAGPALRGRHFVPRLSLYRASLLPPFRAHLLPDAERVTFVSLVPHPDELPDSSLSYMIGAAAEAFASRAHWVVSGRGALDEPRLRAALARLSASGEPCLLLATTLALWHLLERLGERPAPPLPEGSRVMQTGGFKGSGRAVAPATVRERVARSLGVSPERIVGEYGMTELLSQLYTAPGGLAGEYVPPPWLRVRALDPVSLEELPAGREGLLAFFDLANLGSVCHVLTEDVGSVRNGCVTLSGRAAGAEPRGCSRAMDQLMEAAR